MANTHFEVSPESWMAFAWLATNNDRQHCNTRVTMQQLMEGRGLPESNVREIARHLKTFKTVPEVVGMPREWSSANRNKDWKDREQGNPRHQEKRNKRKQEDEWQWGASGQPMKPLQETHPSIKRMMEPYYRKYDHVKGTMICRAAGIHINDLDLRGACLNHILGGCGLRGCERGHPHGSSASHAQVQKICDKLKSGIEKLTGGDDQGGDREQQRRFGRGGRGDRS